MQTVKHCQTPRQSLFSVRLSESDRAIQKAGAAALGLSESEFVRMAVNEKLHELFKRSSMQSEVS
ncbi:MAG TPA: hypothetical protein VHE82_07390 [Gemmatimonadaceae bacterium]|nr:hypothetical protein [Gemmatimonadaceae bacterium]